MNQSITVVLVEDDLETLEHFAHSLQDDHRFQVVASCCSCDEARRAFGRLTPQVFVTDLKLPDGHGFELIEHVCREMPTTEIMVISAFGDEQTVVKAITLGASGYLLKDASPLNIREAVVDLVDGRSPISTAVARHIIKSLQPSTGADDDASVPATLTEREKDILWGIAKGFSYKDIARKLGISPQTVPTHVKSIYRKLDVHSRGEAVFEALQSGLIAIA